MANENENKNAPEDKKKESWLEEALDKVNTDFPLSGGETEEEFEAATEAEDDGYNEDDENTDEPKKDGSGKSWIDDANVDTDFPLSGGEEESK